MSVRSCTTPLQALYNIFVSPTLHHTRQNATRLARHPRYTSERLQSPLYISYSRSFHTSSQRLAKTRPPEQRTQLWNDEIPARRVQLVDEETKSLLPPQTRFDVLRSFDHKTHRLVLVTPPPSDKLDEWIPTCKIVSKKEQYEADKARREQRKESKKGSTDAIKTLELNWAIDANDLAHRLKRMDEFLSEGRKVEIVLAKKKQGRRATEEECVNVLERIREAVNRVKGAKESKKMEGKLGGVVTLFLEGPR